MVEDDVDFVDDVPITAATERTIPIDKAQIFDKLVPHAHPPIIEGAGLVRFKT